MSGTPSAAATTTPTGQDSSHHVLWGFALMCFGAIIGYFWLWGNAIQIQTSEAWILGVHSGLTLSPRLDIFLQVTQLWSGHLTLNQTIAYTWGWLNQIILLALSIGIELHIGGKKRAGIFTWLCVFFVVLNSLADLSYGNAFGGAWQPWAFMAILFMASFFFGLQAIDCVVRGVKRIFSVK